MDQQPTTKEKRGILISDYLFVCSMFIVFCIFIFSLIGVPFWLSNQSERTASADITPTAVVSATQHSSITVTPVALVLDEPHYSYMNEFWGDTGHWPVGPRANEDWVGKLEIKDYAYIWDVDKVKNPFMWSENIPLGENSKDFDITVDSKIIQGNQHEICSGLMFRKSPEGWDSGAYTFSICNDSHFEVYYYGRDERYGKDEWKDLLGWAHTDTISDSDWNQIGVRARGDHFLLMINDEVAFELIDDRQKMGRLAIFIELKEKYPAVVWFDNFRYGSR